jgi:hypothetical protein
MTDAELSKLSLLQLQDLQARLHVAIRAAIRAQQEAKAAHGIAPASQAAAPPAPVLDLARERDAWLARRRAGTGPR